MMMMRPTTTRWLCFPLILILFILVQDARCQLSVGEADAFRVEDLDAGVGKVLESSSLAGASSINAADPAALDAQAGKASHSSSPESAQTGDFLTSPSTDPSVEETTNSDFDDYLTDDVSVTTESGGEGITRRTGETDQFDYPTEDGNEEGVSPTVPQLTRRIVYSGSLSTPTVPEPSVTFSRPSSAVRGLDASDLDIWLPNWPSELLQNNPSPTRRPTIRFPTVSPVSTFASSASPVPVEIPVSTIQPVVSPSYTVSKVPVTQYYFDLTSVVPSPVPGPLFDEEDLSRRTLSSPSIHPDLSRQIVELSSSLSELHSSALFESASPISITPTLTLPSETFTTIPNSVISSFMPATPVPTPTLSISVTGINDGLEREVVDNNLEEDIDNTSTTTLEEDPETHDTETSGPRPPQSLPNPQDGDFDYYENDTADELVTEPSSTGINGELPGTSDLQPISTTNTTTTSDHSASGAGSELVTATSTSTSTSIKPTLVRPSQTINSSRTPLWMLLSQSVPSRPVNTQPPSTQLPSLIPSTTPTTELVTDVTSTSPVVDDLLSHSSSPTISQTTPIAPHSTSTQEISPDQLTSVSLNDSRPQTSQDDIPIIETPAVPEQPQDDHVSASIIPSDPSASSIESSSIPTEELPESTLPDLISGEENPNNTHSDSLGLDTDFMRGRDAIVPISMNSSLEHAENALEFSSPTPSSEVAVNITEQENEISEEPIVINLTDDIHSHPESHLDHGEMPVINASEVNQVTPNVDSSSWTPIVEQTDNAVQDPPVITSYTSITTTTSLVTTNPPELTGGFTPIISVPITTDVVPRSEVLTGTSRVAPSTSTTTVAESTVPANALPNDSSTHSAQLPNMIDSSAPTSVYSTSIDSENIMPNDQSSPDEFVTSDIMTKDDLMPSITFVPTTEQTTTKDEATPLPMTPMFSETQPTLIPSHSLISETLSTKTENVPVSTMIVTERFPSSISVYTPEVFPTPSDTTILHSNSDMTPTDMLSMPESTTVVPESSLSSLFPDFPISSASIGILPESSISPHSPDLPVSSASVGILPESSFSSLTPESSFSSLTPESSISSLPPDLPVSSASVAILPTSITDSPPLVAPTVTEVTTTPTPTHTVHLGEPGEVTEEGTHEESPEKEPGTVKESTTPVSSLPPSPPVTSSPPIPVTSPQPVEPTLVTSPSTPLPPVQPVETVTHSSPDISSQPPLTSPQPPVTSPQPPLTSPQPPVTSPQPPVTSPQPPPVTTQQVPTTTESTTESTTTTTTTTTTTSTTPASEPPTFASPTEPPTPPAPTSTTMFLPNGTMVEAPLPHIRALVTYTWSQFCQHKPNFRTMFSQWITQHLAGEAMVKPRDIAFFNMASCPPGHSEHDGHSNQETSLDYREDETSEIINQVEEMDQETNVYFYVTKSGVMDPDLTEQFPRFPMDLEIDEELIYLKPKVTQLELVRGHGASNTDLLLEKEVAAIGTSVIVIIVICAIVGLTIVLALLFFMVVKRRGADNNYYGRRCTPVSMDAYSMDSVSVYHSFRRKSKRRASGRSIKSYLNQAFDDPNGPSRPLNFAKLTHFISDIDGVHEEFGTIPVNMPKYDELPSGVEDKNRYANVIPVPETRVLLKVNKESRNSEYINANYVRGARNESKYYIATQAPLDDTVADFWRMIWEQETRVIVMLTDFVEKGIDKCADYLPPSETLDCHRLYGDFQVTLKSRDMKETFVVSNVQLKNLENNLVREVAHMWFTGWPAAGVPNEEAAFISFILEVRRTRKKLRAKGPIVIHCSPGTGRTGTLLACDIVMKQFEDQRNIDVARTVYAIRRDRAGAVQTKEQYAFIYRVINLYASKLTSGNLDSL